MTAALMHTTRIAVQIVIDDEAGQFAQLVTALTALAGLLLRIIYTTRPVVVFVADLIEAAAFTIALFSIIGKALAFGLGVRL